MITQAKTENKSVGRRDRVVPLHRRAPKRDETRVNRFDSDAFEACCRMVEMHCRRDEPEAAHAALDRFLIDAGMAKQVITWESPIQTLCGYGEFGLTQREVNILDEAGFLTVRAFVLAKQREFEEIGRRFYGESTRAKFECLQMQVSKELRRRDRKNEALEPIDGTTALSAFSN